MSKFSIFSLFVVGLIFSSANAWSRYGSLQLHVAPRYAPPNPNNGRPDSIGNVAEILPITRDCLKHHNEYRAEHGVPDLSYDEEVSSD